MKIAILSQKAALYSTRRLKEAGEQRGHEMHVVNYLRCYMNITSHRPELRYKGEKLTGYDAVIPRIGASITFYGLAVRHVDNYSPPVLPDEAAVGEQEILDRLALIAAAQGAAGRA